MDGSGWELGFKKAESVAHRFTSSMEHHLKGALVGIFGYEAVKEAYKRTIEYGEKLYDTSQRLVISTDAVQEWDYALRKNGATMEAATGFLDKLGTARDKALAGDSDTIVAFKQFGVSEKDLRDKRLNEIGVQIGNAVKEGDAQKLIGSLREIGGRGAGALVSAFKKGLQGEFDRAHEIGAIIAPEDVTQLKLAGDRVTDLGKKITAELAPAIAVVTKTLRYFTESLFAMIDTDRAFVSGLVHGKGLLGSLIAGEKAWKESISKANAKDKEEREMIEKAKTGGEGMSGEASDEKRKQNVAKEAQDSAIKRAHEQIKLQERLLDMIAQNNREEMSDNEKLNDMIRERNELLKSQSLEDQIKAEKLRGEISKQLESDHGKDTKIQLTDLQKIGAHVSFDPIESALQRNTAAIKENTDALKIRERPEGFDGQSGNPESGVIF